MKNIVFLLSALIIYSGSVFTQTLADILEDKSQENITSTATSPKIYDLTPYPKDRHNIAVNADFLYWGVELDGLNYAISNSAKNSVKQFNFSYAPGFRLGISSLFPQQNNWVVRFEYTYIHSNQSKNIGYGLSPVFNVGHLFENNALNETARSIQAKFDQTFNNLDITLGKFIQPSQWIVFNPYIGIDSAYIDNHFKVNYFSVFGPSFQEPTDLSVNMTTYYWAVGLKGGFNSFWHFNQNFSLISNFGLSILSSHFDVTRKDYTALASTPSQKSQRANVNSSFYTSTTALNLLLGFCYQTRLKSDSYFLSLSCGWEALIWFNMNQNISFNQPNSAANNLYIQGLTIKAQIAF